MPIRKPAGYDAGGKHGVSGPNIQPSKLPPLPGHFGGSKSGKG